MARRILKRLEVQAEGDVDQQFAHEESPEVTICGPGRKPHDLKDKTVLRIEQANGFVWFIALDEINASVGATNG